MATEGKSVCPLSPLVNMLSEKKCCAYLRPPRACPWLDLAGADGAAVARVEEERDELRKLLLLRVSV